MKLQGASVNRADFREKTRINTTASSATDAQPSDSTLTPGDLSKSESDREITRRIRRALTANDQLSTDAKNIKIVTVDGKVTLRGPVKTREEQKTINSIVQQMGVTSVDDQLETKTSSGAPKWS